jgi:hypothetical protein
MHELTNESAITCIQMSAATEIFNQFWRVGHSRQPPGPHRGDALYTGNSPEPRAPAMALPATGSPAMTLPASQSLATHCTSGILVNTPSVCYMVSQINIRILYILVNLPDEEVVQVCQHLKQMRRVTENNHGRCSMKPSDSSI